MAWTEERYIKHMDNYFSSREGQDDFIRSYGRDTPKRLINILESMGYSFGDWAYLQVDDKGMKQALDILRMMRE